MKGDHRKELKTNALADFIGRFITDLKEDRNTTSVVVWIFVLLALGAFAAWLFVSRDTASKRSTLWAALDAAETVQNYEDIANERGTTAQAARFQVARTSLEKGLQDVYSEVSWMRTAIEDEKDKSRKSVAQGNLEKARDQYEILIAECPSPPLLHQEALMGAARAEEGLFAIPVGNDPTRHRGDFDRLLKHLRRLAGQPSETFQVKEARKRVKDLEDPVKREEFEKVYADFRKRVVSPPRRPALDPHEGLFP